MSAISPKDGPVAVTGCSGFTGGHMVRELVLHGYQVRACIRDANSWRGQDCANYLGRPAETSTSWTAATLFTAGSYDDAFKGCSAVFHVAAVLGNSADGKSQPLGSGDVSQDVYDGGMLGTKNVVNAINASGSVKRLVYTSSMAAVSGAKGATMPKGYEWTETDWASDGVEPERWNHPRNAYARSKVDTEHFINDAADASDGRWDAITMTPAMICGPILFKAQVGQWIEQIGRPGRGSRTDVAVALRHVTTTSSTCATSWVRIDSPPSPRSINKASHGGPRYVMHGSGGRFLPTLRHRGGRCHPCALPDVRARRASNRHQPRRTDHHRGPGAERLQEGEVRPRRDDSAGRGDDSGCRGKLHRAWDHRTEAGPERPPDAGTDVTLPMVRAVRMGAGGEQGWNRG